MSRENLLELVGAGPVDLVARPRRRPEAPLKAVDVAVRVVEAEPVQAVRLGPRLERRVQPGIPILHQALPSAGAHMQKWGKDATIRVLGMRAK